MEKEMENTKISEKFNATRIYNPLVGEFYNKEKEREYNEYNKEIILILQTQNSRAANTCTEIYPKITSISKI